MKNASLKDENIALLKRANLKVTFPRLKVLYIMHTEKQQHFSAEDIYKFLIDSNEEIGLATIYRVLNQLSQAKILKRHNFDSKSTFELAPKSHHDHIICVDCGKVFEFEDESFAKKQQEIGRKHGIELDDRSLYLYGKCTKDSDECDKSSKK